MPSEVVAVLYRGGLAESRHYGSIAVVDINGKLVYSHGDAERMTFLRSAAKPLQVLPLFKTGTFDHYQFSLDEVAVMCGSHRARNACFPIYSKQIGLEAYSAEFSGPTGDAPRWRRRRA